MPPTLKNSAAVPRTAKQARMTAAIAARNRAPLSEYIDRAPGADKDFVVAFVDVRKKRAADLVPALEDICRAYKDDQVSIEQLMHEYHATYATIRTVLTQNGVEIRRFGRPKGKHWEGYDRARKITPEQQAWLLAEDAKGTKHRIIATKLGISRERVRQLAAAAGHKPRYTRAAETREQRAAAATAEQTMKQAQREQQRHTPTPHMLKVSELWLKSPAMEIVEIANRLHLNPNSLGVQISRWRQRHPDLFPRRYRALRLAETPVAAAAIPAVEKTDATPEQIEVSTEMQNWLR
jgi:hypothetical protein